MTASQSRTVTAYEVNNNIKKSSFNANDSNINIRCSSKEKEQLKKKAAKYNMTLSEYALKTALSANENKSIKEHRRIENLVHRTDIIQQLRYMRNNSPDNRNVVIPMEIVDELIDMETRLWDI